MSQNFSNKSDIFIPELMELDSYWQKAVEDAICDTLKGEKRLHYALRNRKKINQKMEMLGLKPIPSQLSFLQAVPQGGESKRRKGRTDSCSEPSGDEGNPDLNSVSRTENEENHPENHQRSPDRHLFAARSLEKMKKSQNSFNCEPMGVGGSNDDLSESNAEEEEFNDGMEERNKKIRWLHVRDDGDFNDSDSESAFAFRRNEKTKNGAPKHKNFTLSGLRLPHEDGTEGSHRDDSPVERKSTKGLRRKMHLALTKKEILDANSRASSIGSSSIEIKVEPSEDIDELKRKDQSTMPPFIRFYLEVYRELCHKYSPKHITEEAARRWWAMSAKQRSLYSY